MTVKQQAITLDNVDKDQYHNEIILICYINRSTIYIEHGARQTDLAIKRLPGLYIW